MSDQRDKKQRPALAAILLIILGGVAILAWSSWANAHQACTVGYAGTAATVSAAGPFANQWCETEIQSDQSAYSTQERPSDVLICRYPIGATTYTVRDQGSFYIVGSAKCDAFKRSYEKTGTPAPTR